MKPGAQPPTYWRAAEAIEAVTLRKCSISSGAV